jgi:hypothetical protein
MKEILEIVRMTYITIGVLAFMYFIYKMLTVD